MDVWFLPTSWPRWIMLLASHKVFSVLSWCFRTRSVAVTWYDPCLTQSSFLKTLIIGFSLNGAPPKMGNYPCEVENIHSPAKLTTPFQSRTVTSAVSSQVSEHHSFSAVIHCLWFLTAFCPLFWKHPKPQEKGLDIGVLVRAINPLKSHFLINIIGISIHFTS